MKVFEANITHPVLDYLSDNLKYVASIESANQKIYKAFGIIHFFDYEDDLQLLKEAILLSQNIASEPDRAEYGDFQTNTDLANKVSAHLTTKNIIPEIIIDPTCGKGNFIVASLKHFSHIKKVFGIEIYKPYTWESKFNILDFYLNNPCENKPDISIIHSNIFDFDFKKILPFGDDSEILVIGNPP